MTHSRHVAYSVCAALCSLVLSSGFAVYYVTVQDKQLCSVIEISTQPKPKAPSYPRDPDVRPETEFGLLLEDYSKRQEAYVLEMEQLNKLAVTRLRTVAESYRCERIGL